MGGRSGVTLYVTGSVGDVLEGRPPAAHRWIPLDPFVAGFEAGSPESLETIGEFISFNGVGYSASTASGAGLHQLLTGRRVISNGAVFLPRDAAPTTVVDIEDETPMVTVYERLHDKMRRPFCFLATVTFSRYAGLALSKPPIRSEHIFNHRSAYYSQPALMMAPVPAALMGCVADFRTVSADQRHDLDRVLYENPLDPSGRLTAHTHSLLLHRMAGNVRDIQPGDAFAVRHLVGDSVIADGRFELYGIAGMLEATTAG